MLLRAWAVGLLVLTLALGTGTGTASGQAVVGTVVDSAAASPIAGAVVVARAGGVLLRAETDDAGRFRIDVAAPGRYMLEASHAGYADVAVLYVAVPATGTAEVVLRLRQRLVAGDTLLVQAEARDVRQDATFEGAMARYRVLPTYGFRRVVTHAEPELRNAMKVREVLHWFPSSCSILLHDGRAARGERDFWLDFSAANLEAVEFYRLFHHAPRGLQVEAMAADPRASTGGCSIVALWSSRTPTQTRRPLLKLLGTVAATAVLVLLLR
jgi:hypothetical protein